MCNDESGCLSYGAAHFFNPSPKEQDSYLLISVKYATCLLLMRGLLLSGFHKCIYRALR